MTNADRIRAMTDEELADFIASQRFPKVNPVTEQFIEGRNNALGWLKQESDNGKHTFINAGPIRDMTNEELANYFAEFGTKCGAKMEGQE